MKVSVNLIPLSYVRKNTYSCLFVTYAFVLAQRIKPASGKQALFHKSHRRLLVSRGSDWIT